MILSLNEYIFEKFNGTPLWCVIVLNMFKSSKNLSKENIKDMLTSFCDVEGRLKRLSDYFAEEYPKEYLAYQPNDDDFIQVKSSNDAKDILDKMADFIANHIL